ncbi:MAG: helix-turn-helix domain-containing protein [candidate division WOR-3 bacterium]
MRTKELLRSFGLSGYEAEVYEALLMAGTGRVQDLARMCAVPRPQIYVALARLMDRGLCVEHKGRVSSYSAVAPDMAFEGQLRREEEALKAKAEAVKKLAEEVRNTGRAEAPPRFVEVLRGAKIREFMDAVVLAARQEVLTFLKAAQEKSAESLEGAVRLETALLKRGVRVRCLYEKQSAESPALQDALLRLLRAGEQGRAVDEVPMNMMVVDGRAVMFSLSVEKDDVTVFVSRHPALVSAMRAGFEWFWQKGVPLARVLKARRTGSRD